MSNEKRDTLPALPPGAPPWAATLYDMLLVVIESGHKHDRKTDARLLRLEAEVFGPDTPSGSFCEEDTDPGPRN